MILTYFNMRKFKGVYNELTEMVGKKATKIPSGTISLAKMRNLWNSISDSKIKPTHVGYIDDEGQFSVVPIEEYNNYLLNKSCKKD